MVAAFRRYLITGLLVWAPLGITILVIKLVIDLLDQSLILLPPPLRPENLFGISVPGLGILISAIIILLTGFMVTNLAGKRMLAMGEEWLARIPLVRSIYSAVKQVTETVLTTNKNPFRKVLLVEYPRKGIWTLGFQTGSSAGIVENATNENLLTIFIPTTPNPTSGFIIFVPPADTRAVDLDVESALKLIMSLGVVTPDQKDTPEKQTLLHHLSEKI